MKCLAAVVAVLLAPSSLPVGAFTLRPQESLVRFSVRDNRGGFVGETREVSGSVVVRQSEGGYAAEVQAQVDARTIRTGIALRDAQMRSPAFLHTAAHPFITFSGTVVAASPELPRFHGLLRGQLTVREVTREVEVPLAITAVGNTYTAEGAVVVRFTDFGLPVPRFLFFVAEDAVHITLQVRLQPREPPS
ncbi:MAG: YceI family protein [Armatimonadota bacterium]|nr:YceI family protein [Armatimonadota bacterium]MDR7428286.1 YceI family protein [Armatimonadota bacterium]MDR7469376.1 YceI family protein [Armatimonadota bacterium]MDR7474788.1 YceI family protein [Armatimonadota bacterium]MDR7538474.1 YceI family protein [Armatimonadota bacterium]